MTTKTAKIADLTKAAESIYALGHTAEGEAEAAKVRKLAVKLGIGFEDALQTMLVKKIGYGVIRLANTWYPVVAGEIQPHGYTFSSGAMSDAVHCAAQRGITLKV